ncbi:sigma-54-dependent Fis family transcriptional regulator [Thalassoroseus pseudoceratinae]|uniref:sigma-54-dependent Fis family transcriptional regulator n=1 Tax=Thalassoroseus pseudoceratinae TaxID=2713176 RepID=UPI0014216B93|nr:sigma-54 dependent transcriptional regulator [Thalassoroseus pseudoceratinae]
MFRFRSRITLLVGALTFIYAVLAIGFVATSPDLGVRTVLVDRDLQDAVGEPLGVEIRTTSNIVSSGPRLASGARLLRIGDQPIYSSVDFVQSIDRLRSSKIPVGGHLPAGFEPGLLQEMDRLGLPTLIDVTDSGRWVEVEFASSILGAEPESWQTQTTWLKVQSLPFQELALSLVWFVLQVGFCVLSGWALWQRPFDRTVRIFFLMCTITLGAYVAGQHWWIVSANWWLLLPLVICLAMTPPIGLHFFLLFPRPKRFFQHFPVSTLTAIYAIPVGMIFLAVYQLARIGSLHEAGSEKTGELLLQLHALRSLVRIYSAAAAAYLVLNLATVFLSYRNVRDASEKSQLRWICLGGGVAGLLLFATLVIGLTRESDFATGAARWPLFLASLAFMFAYSVTIVRHKLMFVRQSVSRDVLYYLASNLLTAVISLTIGASILLPQWLRITISVQQALIIAMVCSVCVLLLLWLRDLVQHLIDQRFFRENSRLDTVVSQINAAKGRLGDTQSVSEMVLQFCHDGLGVERGLLYLQTEPDGPFYLSASRGVSSADPNIRPQVSFLEHVREEGAIQRVPASGTILPPEQRVIDELKMDLVYRLRAGAQTEGLIFLGGKRLTGFSSEDLAFLNSVAQIATLALQNARIVDQNITRLNDELNARFLKLKEQQQLIHVLEGELARVHQPDIEVKESAGAPAFRRDSFKGSSPRIRSVLDTAQKVAASESSVLIRGESGTGKEILARLLHDNSPRKDGPLVRVHCAALSPGLLESELFGHVKGAFTGASDNRTGRFELANGGTLFLDEIGDISLETQIKLLRVLQERCFEPVGGNRTVHVDVRLITATHQNLERLISQGKFREDLFYRLNVISLTLPPLRERRGDIPELAMHFLTQVANRQKLPRRNLQSEAMAALERYDWPGNIRELENVIERASVLAEDGRITLKELPLPISKANPRRERLETLPTEIPEHQEAVAESESSDEESRKIVKRPPRRSRRGRPESKSAQERESLEQALNQCDGNKAEAARMLGIPRSTFYSKLKKYELS